MGKQSQIEKTAFNFALQIYKMLDSFPGEEKSLLGFEMAMDAVKVRAGIATFMHLNEINEAFRFLNEAFSATFRIEVCLEVSKDLGYVESIDKPLKALKNLQNILVGMLNREPGE